MYTEIDVTAIDDGEDLDLVMSMLNLIEYSSNYLEKTSSLWFYSKDEADDSDNAIASINPKLIEVQLPQMEF